MKADLIIRPSDTTEHKTITPYHFMLGGREVFFRNLVLYHNDSPLHIKSKRDEMAGCLKRFRDNGYAFWKIYGRFGHPLEFLQWVKRNDYTLCSTRELFTRCQDLGFVDFSGNVCENSCCFMYRIYDHSLIMSIVRELKNIKR